jgi:hypothetical protein
MNTRTLTSLVSLAVLMGCASVPDAAAYHRRLERLRTRDEKAAFAFDLMSRRVIAPPASVDTVCAIFGTQMSVVRTNGSLCTLDIYLSDDSTDDERLPAPQIRLPWILRLDHAVGGRSIDACALLAPGVGK